MASDHTSPCVLVQVYDAAGNGYISRLELANVLRAIVATHNTANPMPEDDFLRLLNAVFESMDILGDNRISFDGAACACEWVWCHVFTVAWCAEFKAGLSDNPMLMEAFLQPLDNIADADVGSQDATARSGDTTTNAKPSLASVASMLTKSTMPQLRAMSTRSKLIADAEAAALKRKRLLQASGGASGDATTVATAGTAEQQMDGHGAPRAAKRPRQA